MLATSLCTWSPNELAHTVLLVSSRYFSGAIAEDLTRTITDASSSSLDNFHSDSTFLAPCKTPKLGEVAPR